MTCLLDLPSELLELIINCLRFGSLRSTYGRQKTPDWKNVARTLRLTCKALRAYIDSILWTYIDVKALSKQNTSRLETIVQSPWLKQTVETYHLAPIAVAQKYGRALIQAGQEDLYDPCTMLFNPDLHGLKECRKTYAKNADELRDFNQQSSIMWSMPDQQHFTRIPSLFGKLIKESRLPLTSIFSESIYLRIPESFPRLDTLIITLPTNSESCRFRPKMSEQVAIGLGQLLARKKLSISTLNIESINPQHVRLIMDGAAKARTPSLANGSDESIPQSDLVVESVQHLTLLMYDRSFHKSHSIPSPRQRARVWRDLDPYDGIGRLLAAFPNLRELNMRFNGRSESWWSTCNEWLILDKFNAPEFPKLESIQLSKIAMHPSDLVKMVVQSVKKDHPTQDYSCHCKKLKLLDLLLIRDLTNPSEHATPLHTKTTTTTFPPENLYATNWADIYYAWSRRLMFVLKSASPTSQPPWRKWIFDNDMYLDIKESGLRISRQTDEDTKAFDEWHEFQYVRFPKYKGNAKIVPDGTQPYYLKSMMQQYQRSLLSFHTLRVPDGSNAKAQAVIDELHAGVAAT